jgi:hypothetical protein
MFSHSRVSAIQTIRKSINFKGIFLLFCLFGFQASILARDLYWVGGTGNWSDPSHWSSTSGGTGGSPKPNENDNVFFDGNSFTATGQTVMLDVTAPFHDMDWSGALYQPTLTGAGELDIYGSLKFITNMTFAPSAYSYFYASAPGQLITSAEHSFYRAFFLGTGGWVLQDKFSGGQYLFHYSGSLNTNNQEVSCENFSSGGDNTRELILGSSIIETENWSINNSNIMFDAGSSTIQMTGDNSIFNCGGSSFTYNRVVFQKNGSIGNYCKVSTLKLSPGRTYSFGSESTTNILDSLIADGDASHIIYLRASTTGSQATISKSSGSVTLNYVALKDMNAAGGATFTANNYVDLGNNTGWNFTGSDVSLPIQMSNFSAGLNKDKGITLSWWTESEVSCAGFYIWKSTNNGEFKKITTALIPGQGNSSSRHYYKYLDNYVEAGVDYSYKIENVSEDGSSIFYGPIKIADASPIPNEFSLSQNYPNPFNPETKIDYTIPHSGFVKLTVYDISGKEIATLVNEPKEAGYYSAVLNSHGLSSGVYFYRLISGDFTSIKKMVLMK